jgi:hypothetical protein
MEMTMPDFRNIARHSAASEHDDPQNTERPGDRSGEPAGAGEAERSYAVLVLTYLSFLIPLLALADRRGRLARRPSAAHIVVFGVATHKLSRILSRGKVASFARAPFTEYEEASHLAEVNERPRGRGLRRAVGELLTCPFCIGMWISGAFTVGNAFAPGVTLAGAAVLNSLTLSDFLHLAYVRAARATE